MTLGGMMLYRDQVANLKTQQARGEEGVSENSGSQESIREELAEIMDTSRDTFAAADHIVQHYSVRKRGADSAQTE